MTVWKELGLLINDMAVQAMAIAWRQIYKTSFPGCRDYITDNAVAEIRLRRPKLPTRGNKRKVRDGETI